MPIYQLGHDKLTSAPPADPGPESPAHLATRLQRGGLSAPPGRLPGASRAQEPSTGGGKRDIDLTATRRLLSSRRQWGDCLVQLLALPTSSIKNLFQWWKPPRSGGDQRRGVQW